MRTNEKPFFKIWDGDADRWPTHPPSPQEEWFSPNLFFLLQGISLCKGLPSTNTSWFLLPNLSWVLLT